MKWIKVDQKTGEPMKNSGTSFFPHDYVIEGYGLKYRIVNNSFAVRKNAWVCTVDGEEIAKFNTLKDAKSFLEGYAERNTKRSSYDVKKSYMEHFYASYRKMWDGVEARDDRLLFCNMYDQIMNALEEMKGIESAMIWVGFNNECDKSTKTMDKIIEHFKDREIA